jgi:hypothetical protein
MKKGVSFLFASQDVMGNKEIKQGEDKLREFTWERFQRNVMKVVDKVGKGVGKVAATVATGVMLAGPVLGTVVSCAQPTGGNTNPTPPATPGITHRYALPDVTTIQPTYTDVGHTITTETCPDGADEAHTLPGSHTQQISDVTFGSKKAAADIDFSKFYDADGTTLKASITEPEALVILNTLRKQIGDNILEILPILPESERANIVTSIVNTTIKSSIESHQYLATVYRLDLTIGVPALGSVAYYAELAKLYARGVRYEESNHVLANTYPTDLHFMANSYFPSEITDVIGDAYSLGDARGQLDRMRTLVVNKVMSQLSLSDTAGNRAQALAYVNAFVDDLAEYAVLISAIQTQKSWQASVLDQTYDPSKVDTSVLALAAPQQEGNILDGNATKLARLANGDYKFNKAGTEYDIIMPENNPLIGKKEDSTESKLA